MRAGYRFIALAMAAVVTATSLLTVGCATPPTPGSMAADAAAKAAAPTTPPTSATAGNQTIVAIQPAAPPAKQCTLCGFLGLDKIGAGIGGLFQRAFSRIKSALGLEGRFPGLQPKPPILSITDPANMGPNSPPAVKAAAEAKMEEDQAGQKVQALRYLATIGCGGCYPGIEEAMLAALDDCTEAVRYEAVLALRGNGNVCCAYCRCQSCCSPNVRKKLDALANTRDDQGCYAEPSERVRRLSRVVLGACGGLIASQETAPSEGPTPAPPLGAAAPAGTTASHDADLVLPAVQLVSFEEEVGERSMHDAVLARVNGEEILESRLLPLAEAEVAERRSRGEIISPEEFQTVVDRQVRRAIDAKLLLHQARQDFATAGRTVEKLSPEEVDEWLKATLHVDAYVSLTELNAYYRAHAEQFQGPPEVRWEQVTIWIKDASSREKAVAAAESLRRRAAGDTAAPADVDLSLADTQIVDFTPLDRIEPAVLWSPLKSLPIGATSPVIDHRSELFLVRVLERRAGKPQSFDEAMHVIRKEILAERKRQAEQTLLTQLRQGAQIWTASGDSLRSEPATPPTAPRRPRRALAPLPNLSPPTPVPPAAAPQRLPNIVPRKIQTTPTDGQIQQAGAWQSTNGPSHVVPATPGVVQDRGFPAAFKSSPAPRPQLIPLPPPDGPSPSSSPVEPSAVAPIPAAPTSPPSAPVFSPPLVP